MLILALDTSSPAGSLAVLRDGYVIGAISTWTEETYSSRMFRHIDFLLQELSLGLNEFDLFAVAAGPGSFTGLRVGLTAAKGWAEVYRKPVAAISGLEAVAAQSRSTAALLVPVLDARRGQVYFGFYRRRDAAANNEDLTLEGKECVMTPEEFHNTVHVRAGSSAFLVVTPTPKVLSDSASPPRNLSAPLSIEQVSSVLAPVVGRLGYRHAQRGSVADSLTLDANYVRRSDAELNWKGPKGL